MVVADTTPQAADLDDAQYSLTKILTIWAVVAVPMPILAFIVAPAIADEGTMRFGIIFWVLMIAGMIWQFVVSMFVLAREGSLRSWAVFKERVWLNAPRDPDTGERRLKAFWWLIPALVFGAVLSFTPVGGFLGELILIPFPSLAELPEMDLTALAVEENVGAWWILGVAIVAFIFNYILGEELLFRGVLLPRMRGVFGKWDWVANAVLFALYHLALPLRIVSIAVGTLAWTLPSRYYRSNWFALILHGVEGIVLLVLVLGVITGLAF